MEYVIAEHKGKPVATQLKVISEATSEETPVESNTESHNNKGGLWLKK